MLPFQEHKKKCLIVADVNGIKKKHSDTSLIRKAITYCEAQHYPFIPADKVLPKYTADDRTEQWLEKITITNLEKKLQSQTCLMNMIFILFS